MKAAIVSIGDELLIGQTINTNASWMGKKITDFGIKVERVFTIADQENAITDTFNFCVQNKYDFVFITGGLGPTKDDITKKVFAKFFNSELVYNEEVLQNVQRIFKAYNREVKSVNVDQSLVPKEAKVFINQKGTAPAMWMQKNNSVFVSMPGVPREMEYLMDCEILPFIQNNYNLPVIYRKTLLTQGIGESFIAEIIEHIEDALPSHIKLAYLPSAGMVKLRLSAYGEDIFVIKNEVYELFNQIVPLLQDYVFGWDEDLLEQIVVNLLKEKGLSIAFAESLTSGTLSKAIASIPGASSVLKGGVVAYQNSIKVDVLGVSAKNIDQFTAVSEEVVKEMVVGVQKMMHSDIAVATSGIAGPDGGTEEIPVGSVWLAIYFKGEILTQKFNLGEGRDAIVLRTLRTVLNWLRKLLEKSN
jgi:nicotinamide-nucleotide amidase